VVPGEKAIRKIVRSGTNLIGEPAAVLFRTETIDKAGDFSAQHAYSIDIEYWCRVLQQGSLFVINEPLASFRISQTSWSSVLAKKQAKQTCDCLVHIAKLNGIQERDIKIGCLKASLNSFLRRIVFGCYGFISSIAERRK